MTSGSFNLGSVGIPWATGYIQDVQSSSLSATSSIASPLGNIDDVQATSVSASDIQTGTFGATSGTITTLGSTTVNGGTINGSKIAITSTSDSSNPCPSMSEAQRDLIGSPAVGSCVYNTDALAFNVYDGTVWKPLGSGGGGGGLDIYSQENFEDFDLADIVSGSNSSFLGAGSLDGVLSLEIVSPTAGTTSLKYTAGASSLNDYFALPVINLDEKQRLSDSGLVFTFTWSGTSNIEAVVYDVTNGQKLNSSLNLVKNTGPPRYTASFKPASNTSQIRIGFHFLVAPTNGDVLQVDDLETSTNPFIYKNIVENQYLFHNSALSTMVNVGATSNYIAFNLANIKTSGPQIVTYRNASDRTEFECIKDCTLNITFGSESAGANAQMFIHRSSNGGERIVTGSTAYTTSVPLTASGTFELKAGEYAWIQMGSIDLKSDSTQANLTIHAQASTENVLSVSESSVTVEKFLSGDVSTTQDLADFQFNNLIVGNQYIITGTLVTQSSAGWKPALEFK